MDLGPAHDLEYLRLGVLLTGVALFFLFGFVTRTRRAWLLGTLTSWAPLVGYYWIFAGNLQN